jgi:YHS domain-containing protein
VTGDELDEEGAPVVYNYQGRDIRFCCTDCIAKFEASPDTYIAKLDAAIIAQQKDSYPAGWCPISEEALDSMGGPEWIVVGNTLIGLCCGGCEADVRAEPQKYIDWVNAQVVKQLAASYKATTCPVTGEELGEGAVDYVYAGKLLRFCCEDCIGKFEADPQKYLGQPDARALKALRWKMAIAAVAKAG